MFETRDIILSGLIVGLLTAAALCAWPWSWRTWRFVYGGVTTSVGFMAWNFTLNHTNATGFDVDAPVVRVSWQDAGTAVCAFALTALVLGLVTDRREPAQRVVGAATIAGVVGLVFDTFFF